MPGRRDDDDDFWPFESLGEAAGSDALPAAPPRPSVAAPQAHAPISADPTTDPLPRPSVAGQSTPATPPPPSAAPATAAAPAPAPAPAAPAAPRSEPPAPRPAPPEDEDRPIRRPPPPRRTPTAPRARSIAPEQSSKRTPLAAVRRQRVLAEVGQHGRLFDVALVLLAVVVAVLVVLALQS